MSVVFRAKKSLKCLKVDSSFRRWSGAALKKLGKKKEQEKEVSNFSSAVLFRRKGRYRYTDAEILG